MYFDFNAVDREMRKMLIYKDFTLQKMLVFGALPH